MPSHDHCFAPSLHFSQRPGALAPMRVLRLTPFFHHPDTKEWPAEYDAVGGMQIQVWRQAMWLAQHGVKQHVLTLGFPGLPHSRDLHPNLRVERAYLPLPKIRSELTGLWGLTSSWALATLLKVRPRARQTPFDMVHVHLDGQIPALLVAKLMPVLLQRPMVLSIHCSRLAVYQPMSHWDLAMHRIACRLERQALAAATVVIALTEHTASVVRPYSRQVEVIPDVVDPLQFSRPGKPQIEAFRQQHQLKGTTVGFIGRIAHEKGWSHFVALAERLRASGLQFLVVGDGPQRKRLEAMLVQHRLQSHFVLTGFIPNDQIPLALAACSVVVMPSEHEEFGSVAIEALAIGTPVVAYAVGGIKSVLGERAPQRLAPPGDIDQLTACVQSVLVQAANSAGYDPLSFDQAFSPDNVLPHIGNLYYELMHCTTTCSGAPHASRQAAANTARRPRDVQHGRDRD